MIRLATRFSRKQGAYCAANEEGLIVSSSAVSSVDIGRQNTAYDVSQVAFVVGVWQGRGDEDISLPFNGEDGLDGAIHAGG